VTRTITTDPVRIVYVPLQAMMGQDEAVKATLRCLTLAMLASLENSYKKGMLQSEGLPTRVRPGTVLE